MHKLLEEESVKLDLRDRKILHQLDWQARMPLTELAKKLRTSPEVVAYRIKQLEKKKVINGYHTVVDFSKLGYTMYRIFVTFSSITTDAEKEIINVIGREKTNILISKASGDWDLILAFLAKKPKEFEEMWIELKKKLKEFMSKKSVTIVYERIHFPKDYIVGKTDISLKPMVTGLSDKVSIDEEDVVLLKLLSDNARMSLIDLAELLKTTPSTVRYRIKNLERQGVILGYRAEFDLSKLGRQQYLVDLDIKDLSIIPMLKEELRMSAECIYIDGVIGGKDFEFTVEVKRHREFIAFTEWLRDKYHGAIKKFNYSLSTKVYKIAYMVK
jgi:Lrp/AsnC family transcriptional regulator, leucine-responsive regulatory protein